MEPINLRPLLRPILILNAGPCSINSIVQKLSLSKRRASAIIRVLMSLNLISKDEELYRLTENGSRICDCIMRNQWHLIHDYLKIKHTAYASLNVVIEKGYRHEKGEGIPRNEIGDCEKALSAEHQSKRLLLTNDVIISFLLDWGERLGKIVENKLSRIPRLFVLRKVEPSERDYRLLANPYRNLSGSGLGKRPYVSIPLLREYSCEILRISRKLFDAMLVSGFHEQPRNIRLIGAPEPTLTVKNARRVKSIAFTENNLLEVESSPLYGLEVNNREFYYIKIEVDSL